MRVLIAALLLTLSSLAHAQTSRAPAGQPPASTLPPIGLPLPEIGLPLPPIGLGPAGPTPTTSPAPAARGRAPQRGPGPRRGRTTAAPALVYVVPGYGWDMTTVSSTPGRGALSAPGPALIAPDEAATRPATGTLHLDLQPRPTGQLFVDGAYVGTIDELGTDLTLLAGTRRLEIRQPGYRPFELTARIADGRALVFTGALEAAPPNVAPAPAAATASEPASPIVRKPLYYIPGCYLGDVPPQDAGLPATCDVSRAVIFKP